MASAVGKIQGMIGSEEVFSRSIHLPMTLDGQSGGSGVVQNFVFNQPINSPYEIARACRLAERRGLAAIV